MHDPLQHARELASRWREAHGATGGQVIVLGGEFLGWLPSCPRRRNGSPGASPSRKTAMPTTSATTGAARWNGRTSIRRRRSRKPRLIPHPLRTLHRNLSPNHDHALEQLEAALPLLTDTLRRHWSTGQGKRIRAIVWSLYGGDHPVGLGYALVGLDDKLARAIGTAIQARIAAGAAVEPLLKTVLEEAGELRRYEEAAAKVPEGLPVPYPAPELTAAQLRELADALDILYPAD